MSNHGGVCERPDAPRRERVPAQVPLHDALARTPDGPFAELLSAAELFRSHEGAADGAGASQLLDLLVILRHTIDLLELSFSSLAHRFRRAELAARPHDGVTPLFTMRSACRMAAHVAADAACIGEQAPSLPRSTAALEEGRIGIPHLALIARTAEELADSPLGFDEARLLPLAERHPLRRFGRDCAHARHAGDQASFLREQQLTAEARWLDVRPLGNDAGYDVRGFLDRVGGAAVHAVLDSLARPCGKDDRRDRRHRLGDAAVELCGHILDEGGIFLDGDDASGAVDAEAAGWVPTPDENEIPPALRNAPVARMLPVRVLQRLDLAEPCRAPWGGVDAREQLDPHLWDPLAPRRPALSPDLRPVWVPAEVGGSGRTSRRRHVPHLNVSASLETLLGLPHAPAGELEGVPVAAATVARFACSSSVSRILLGPKSAIVDVGRERRVPSAAARRLLAHRDRGCIWPGCDRPPRWTQPHHFQHWAHDGASDAGNMGLLCLRHHVMTHEGGWVFVHTEHGPVPIPPPPEYPFLGRPLSECAQDGVDATPPQPVKLRPT